MNNWMEGYSSDVEYTAQYYKEITPNHLNFTAVLNGIEPIDVDGAFNYCELGCGQGVTVLVLAALYPQGRFWGVDYNPSHIAKAKKLVKEAGLTNITFLESSFGDLVANKTILPQVEFMVFHGIYTWVNGENRANLVEICKEHVVSGGFVYNSYNAKPGWNDGEVLQKLIFELSKESSGDSIKKMDAVVNRLKNIKNIKSGFFQQLSTKIDGLNIDEKNYLVHEYLHEDWKAFYFGEVSKDMASAKLSYLAQASPEESYMKTLLPNDIKEQLQAIDSIESRELIIDLAINRGFRRDIYTKGVSGRLSKVQQTNWLLDKKWILVDPSTSNQIEFEFTLPLGKVKGDAKIYKNIIKHLQSKVLTTKELMKLTSLDITVMLQSLTMLYSASYIRFYEASTNNIVSTLNKFFANNYLGDDSIKYIIAPYIKEVIYVNATNSILLDGLYQGINESEKLVDYVYSRFKSHDIAIIDDNQNPLQGNELKKSISQSENILREELLEFWKKIGIV